MYCIIYYIKATHLEFYGSAKFLTNKTNIKFVLFIKRKGFD